MMLVAPPWNKPPVAAAVLLVLASVFTWPYRFGLASLGTPLSGGSRPRALA